MKNKENWAVPVSERQLSESIRSNEIELKRNNFA